MVAWLLLPALGQLLSEKMRETWEKVFILVWNRAHSHLRILTRLEHKGSLVIKEIGTIKRTIGKKQPAEGSGL